MDGARRAGGGAPRQGGGPELFAKEYFKIGEVARLVGVKPYVLRYWETEFRRAVRPERSRTNQRLYRRRDVEAFLEIKRLRYDEKLELDGARRRLQRPASPEEAEQAAGRKDARLLEARNATLRRGLEELIRIVDEDENDG